MKPYRRFCLRFPLLLFLLLGFAFAVGAQRRESVVGAGINLVGGGANDARFPGGVLGRESRPLEFFYGVYPSVRFSSTGGRSLFDASYAFGWRRTGGEARLSSESHSASASFSSPLSARWSFRVSDSFMETSDATTFNALQGVIRSGDEVPFVFDPVAVGQSSRTNSASMAAGYAFSSRSTLSFSGTHALRSYGRGNRFRGTLSDQQSISAGVTFTRRTDAREGWNVGYSAAYFDYQDFDNASSQAAQVGYFHEFQGSWTLDLAAGMAHVKRLGVRDSYIGYNTSASLRKAIQDSTFTFFYSQQAGQPSGLGSTSDRRRAGMAISTPLGPARLFLDASAFDAEGRLDNPYRTRGVAGAATLGFPLTETLSLQAGGQYQKYDRTSDFGFTRNRVFLSLRYNDPDLWRWSR